MSRKMEGRDISEMGRQIERHLNALEQLCLEPLNLYVEAVQWSYKSPIELLRYQNDPGRQHIVSQMTARSQQLYQWAERFEAERNRFVQMVNRYPPRAIQMSGLEHRIRNVITKMEKNVQHFQALSESLQDNLQYLNNPDLGQSTQYMAFSPLTSTGGSGSSSGGENMFEDNLLEDDLDDILNSSSSRPSSRQSRRMSGQSGQSRQSGQSGQSTTSGKSQESDEEESEEEWPLPWEHEWEEADIVFENLNRLPDDFEDWKASIRPPGSR